MAQLYLKVVLCALLALSSCIGSILASPNAQCLQCICHASSGCKSNIRCHNSGAGQYFCGPYQISWAYWADAGKPGYTGFSNDFENCLVDKNCAEATVRGYMAKWATADCNGDGTVDCLDYAAIHKAGPTGCNQQWLLNSKYWTQFNQCYGSSPLPASASPSISPPFRAISGNPPAAANTIIEIPQPRPPRPLAVPHASAISSSSGSSVAFGPARPLPGPLPGHSTFSSASSFSRHNFSHSEVEITETESVNSNSFSSSSSSSSSSGNRLPVHPNFIASGNSFPVAVPVSVPRYKPLPPLPPPPPPAPAPHRPSAVPIEAPRPSVSHHEEIITTSYHNNNNNNNLVPKPPNFSPLVPQNCLQCLCQASSKCDLNKGCDGAYCGPFLLSWGYWADGGKPGNGLDYASCAKDRSCSELAVQGYMNKWTRDCNNDNVVDCTDYALIHKLGPHACGKVEAIQLTEYWKNFAACYNPTETEDRNPIIRSVVSGSSPNAIPEDSSPSSNRFIVPVKPEVIYESESNEPEQPSLPASNNFPSNAQPETPGHIRISFNNREIVNVSPNSRVPPATVHHHPHTVPHRPDHRYQSQPSQPAPVPQPASSLPTESEVVNVSPTSRVPPATVHHHPHSVPHRHDHNYNNQNQPAPVSQPTPASLPNENEVNNINSNIISNSPLARPTFSHQPSFTSNPAVPSTNWDIRRTALNGRPLEAPERNRPLPAEPERVPSEPTSWNSDSLSPANPPPPPSTPTETSIPKDAEVDLAPIRHHHKPSASNSTSGGVSMHVVTQECLECICHASSRCSSSLGCVNDGSGKYICGPYQVNWEYWADAGKPGNRADLSNLENFQMCLTNRQCADETVRAYMLKWRKDCNDDGVINCEDFAALHVAGPRNCNAQWYLDSQYYSDFRSCNDFRRR